MDEEGTIYAQVTRGNHVKWRRQMASVTIGQPEVHFNCKGGGGEGRKMMINWAAKEMISVDNNVNDLITTSLLPFRDMLDMCLWGGIVMHLVMFQLGGRRGTRTWGINV